MKWSVIVASLLGVVVLTACNLASAPADEEPLVSDSATEVSPISVTPVLTSVATEDVPTSGANSETQVTCTPRTDWPTYTVQSGDTLFSIVQISRAGITVDDLATANCLDNPDNLVVGQTLYVPNAIRTGELLVYWASIPAEAISDETVVVACDAVINPIISEVGAVSDDPVLNTRNRLMAMFGDTRTHGGGWRGHGLTVQSLTIDASGHAELAIGGDFLFPGHCGDGVLEAEMLFTIFEEPEINSVRVIVTGRNLRQIIDLSGRTGMDYIYTRDYLPPQ